MTRDDVTVFLENLREDLLHELKRASKQEYELYRRRFGQKWAPGFAKEDSYIWRDGIHRAGALESIRKRAEQHLQSSGGQLSTIKNTLQRLTSNLFETGLWHDDYEYRTMVIKGLLCVYIPHCSLLSNAGAEDILFSLYAMERILPYLSDYGGPGLAEYTDCAHLLVDLGFRRRAELLRIFTADLPTNFDDLDDSKYSALRTIMDFRSKVAFFTCADLFIDAACYVKKNADNAELSESFVRRFVSAAVSAFNEDFG